MPGAPSARAEARAYDVALSLMCEPDYEARVLLGADGERQLCVSISETETRVLALRGDSEVERATASGLALPSSGPVDLRIRQREDDVRVDHRGRTLLQVHTLGRAGLLGLSADSVGSTLDDIVVQPVEPPHFGDDFTDAESVGATWDLLSGEWQVRTYRDPLVAQEDGPPGAAWYEASGVASLAAVGHPFWDHYSVSVSARWRPGETCGVVAGLDGGGDHVRLEVRDKADGTQCALIAGAGEGRVLAEGLCDARPGHWYRLRLAAAQDRVEGYVDDQLVLSAAWPTRQGRAGLYASGTGVAFDDVRVAPAPGFVEDFDDGAARRWRLRGDGGEVEDGAGLRLTGNAKGWACVAGWADVAVEAELCPAASTEAGVLAGGRRGEGYALGVVREGDALRWRLAWLDRDEGLAELAGGRCERAGESVRVVLARQGPELRTVVDGQLVGTAYDFRQAGTEVGLFAQGRVPVAFTAFEAKPIDDEPVLVSAIDGSGRNVPRPYDGNHVPALGLLWRPVAEGLRVDTVEGARVLFPVSREDRCGVSYYQPMFGNTEIAADVHLMRDGAEAWLGLGAAGIDEPSPCELRVACRAEAGSSMEIVSNGKVVAERAVPGLAPGAPFQALLRRSDEHIVGLLYEGDEWEDTPSARVVVRDAALAEAAGSGYAHVSVDGVVAVREARLLARSARPYPFERVPVGWEPVLGEWRTHAGITCIANDHWLTAVAEPLALLVHRQPSRGNVMVHASVSEYTEGHEAGSHAHLPYHDFGVILGCRGQDSDTGYRFVIGADRGQAVCLFRDGELVVRNEDPAFQIAIGGGYNLPRTVHVVAQKTGNRLRLWLEGALAVDYEDESQALPAGHVGLFAEDCLANFHDVIVME